jgi:hypothetical protein
MDGVLQVDWLAVAPGTAAWAADDADAELAAAQMVAVLVAAGAARRLVVGVHDEDVSLADQRRGAGSGWADELAGVMELLGSVER